MDLERLLLEADLDDLQDDADSSIEIAEDVQAFLREAEYRKADADTYVLIHQLKRLTRRLRIFHRRWKDHGTANASPKANEPTPEVKKKKH